MSSESTTGASLKLLLASNVLSHERGYRLGATSEEGGGAYFLSKKSSSFWHRRGRVSAEKGELERGRGLTMVGLTVGSCGPFRRRETHSAGETRSKLMPQSARASRMEEKGTVLG